MQHIAEQGIAARKAWALASRADHVGANPPAGRCPGRNAAMSLALAAAGAVGTLTVSILLLAKDRKPLLKTQASRY